MLDALTNGIEIRDLQKVLPMESALAVFEDMCFPFEEAPLRRVVENMVAYEDELISFLSAICNSYKNNFTEIYEYFEDDRLFLTLHTLVAAGSKRVFPYFLEILRFPNEFVEGTFGDQVTESFSGMLATVFDGNVDALCNVILEETVWEYCRWSAFDALKILAEKDDTLRVKIIEVVRELHRVDSQNVFDVPLPFVLLESVLNLKPVELRDEIPLWYARADLDYRSERLMSCEEVMVELDEQRYSHIDRYNYPYDLWNDLEQWQHTYAANQEYALRQLEKSENADKEKQRRKSKAAKKARRKNRRQ